MHASVGGWFQGCSRDEHRNNWRCACAVPCVVVCWAFFEIPSGGERASHGFWPIWRCSLRGVWDVPVSTRNREGVGGTTQCVHRRWRSGELVAPALGRPFGRHLGVSRGEHPILSNLPPPPCLSYALVQATVGVGTVLIWYLILIRYQI